MPSSYVPLELGNNDIDDDFYVTPQFGRTLRKSTPTNDVPPRTDLILWDPDKHQEFLDKNLKVPDDLDPALKAELLDIIKTHWDAFDPEGAGRPMLGFEFCIDTGASQPVKCAQTRYGIHESPIIQKHINDLQNNNHIRKLLGGSWLSKGLLAPKPHQEHIDNIDDFIWRFCINYRPLNSVTKPFLHPIPRCDDTFDIFYDRKGRRLFFISFDAKSGYHQVAVYGPDQEKTAFYGPDFQKYCYTVMPFGPLNAPAVYTAIMQILCTECSENFKSRCSLRISQRRWYRSDHRRRSLLLARPLALSTLVSLFMRSLCQVPPILQPQEMRLLPGPL